jgi:hypothetical protein
MPILSPAPARWLETVSHIKITLIGLRTICVADCMVSDMQRRGDVPHSQVWQRLKTCSSRIAAIDLR